MKKILFALISTLFFIGISAPVSYSAQYWAKTYGGNNDEYAFCTQQTADGGFIVTGYTESFGVSGWDVWILKLDANGDVLWEKTYGGTKNEMARTIRQTFDSSGMTSGYIVAGISDSFGSANNDEDPDNDNLDMWVLRLDEQGDIVWQKRYGEDTTNDYAHTLIQTFNTDGSTSGFIVAGFREYSEAGETVRDMWTLKLYEDGTVEKDITYQSSRLDNARCIQQIFDASGNPTLDYIVTGYVEDFGDMWVLKINESGDVCWQKIFGTSLYPETGTAVQQIFDSQNNPDGYIISGLTVALHGGNYSADYWLIKLDENGAIEWQKTYGGENHEFVLSIDHTEDGGYVAAGYVEGTYGTVGHDCWIVKLDEKGSIQWQKTYGGPDFEECRSIQQTSDGGYIVAATTSSFGFGNQDDIWMLKLNANGEIVNCDISQDTGVIPVDSTVIGQDSDVEGILSVADDYDTFINGEISTASVYAICEYTLVEMSSFSSYPAFKEVRLAWKTVSEIDNFGFNIYRAESKDGPYIKINDKIIPAEGSPVSGADYSFVDTGVKNRKTYYYQLEDIDMYGVSSLHGPINAVPRMFPGL